MDLDLRGELQIGGVWVDATGKILKRQSLSHTRGRQDQASRVDPSTLRPLLNNTDGRFSPDNPLGPYYGQFGRNTPFRLSLAAGSPALVLPGNVGDHASTPDDASLDITGDIDVRVDAQLANWAESTAAAADTVELIGKYSFASGTKSWWLGTRADALFFQWSVDGTAALSASSTVPLPIPASGRMAVRVTMDADNGASGRTITFYTAPSGTSGPWTQLGEPVVQSGTTSIANTTTALKVGDASDIGYTRPIGRVHRAEIRSGIGGSVVANPDFTAQTVGTTSFADGAGRTWTVNGGTSISNRRTRLTHELAAYPTSWHPSGAHAWVAAQTAGILRRLRRSTAALDSTLRRRIPSGSPVAYWPLEEGSQATQFYSPIPGVRPLRTSGMNLAADDSLAGSSALPTLRGGAMVSGTVPAPSSTSTQWHTEFVFLCQTGPATARTVLQWLGTGTVKRWRLMLDAGGAQIYGYDEEDTVLVTELVALTSLGVFGAWTRWKVFATQNGGNVDYTIAWVPIGGSGGFVGGSYAGTVGRISGVKGPDAGYASDLDGLALGHLGVFATADTLIYNDADIAFTGETAGERMQRLTVEEALPVTVCGVVGEQVQVGPQRPDAVLSLLEEAAEADGGILYEDRDLPRLRYRDRASMYNQTPALVLDYNAPGLAPPLEPTGDDDATENDVTVTRVNGSSGRAVLEEGALSVLDPPNGVGPYPSSVSLNLDADEQAEPIAYWRMHLGTYEGRRYPQVHVMVHAAPGLADQVLAVDVGDKIVIRNPPIWIAPGDIELIVQGYEESFAGPFQWDIVFNCTPGRPWTVGVVEEIALEWADADGSELATAATSTATTLDVLTTVGQVWRPDPFETPFDLLVGGEEVRVTAGGRLLNANPFFDSDISGWTGSNATISRTTTANRVHPQAVASLTIAPDGVNASGGANGTMTAVGSIIPGALYKVSLWAFSAGGWSDLRPAVDWHTSGGTYISSGLGSGFAVPAGQWTYLEQTVTAPATASRAVMRARHGGTPSQADTWHVWAVRITQTKAGWLHDAFGRTSASGWGTSDSGLAWVQVGGGTSADYIVGSGYGSQVLATLDTSRRTAVTAIHADFDLYCDVTTSALATGDSLFGGPTARMVDASNMYQCRAEFTTGNAIVVSIRKILAGANTAVGSTYTLPGAHVAGTFVRIRFQGQGSTLRAKAWLASAPEPPGWHIEGTDTSFTAAAQIGTRSIRVTGNTNAADVAIRYDTFDVINPQVMTVDRSRNGIAKAQAAGEDVRLAYPTIVAL